MSDLTIRNCVFSFKCSAVWEQLEDTDSETVRFCQDCQREVHYCDTDDELVTAVKLNRCVAFEKEPGNRLLGSVVYNRT